MSGVARGAENAESARVSSTASSSASAPAGAAAGDAINATKRDFDAIKAARDPSQQQKGALPKLGVPDLQTGTAEPRPWASTKQQKLDQAGKKSANWLVDAMAQDARERSAERERSGRDRVSSAREESKRVDEDRLAGEAESEAEALARSRKQSASDEAREASDRRERPAAPNPLTQFLGQWMTPGDYAILKPGLDESLSRISNGDTRDSGGLSATLSDSLVGIGGLASGATSPTPATSVSPRENPYLQSLETPAAGAATGLMFGALAVPMTQPAAPVSSPPAIAPIPPPSVPAPPKIPDFAKPAHDEKYFKQLKRF